MLSSLIAQIKHAHASLILTKFPRYLRDQDKCLHLSAHWYSRLTCLPGEFIIIRWLFSYRWPRDVSMETNSSPGISDSTA